MILPSRKQFKDSNDFVEQFLETLTIGIIPRANFIDWETLEKNLKELEPAIDFYQKALQRNVSNSYQEIGDSIISSDNPLSLFIAAWVLIGHTNNYLVTREDDFTLENLLLAAETEDSQTLHSFVEAMMNIGLLKVLERQNPSDVALGIQLGLESHKRKNRGGNEFISALRPIMQLARETVFEETGIELELREEVRISYGKSQSKKVDFYLECDFLKFGFEANFYTVSGSKPTEIKRSYNSVWRGLLEQDIHMVWITDGKGYQSMKRSLGSAYEIVENVYNRKQLETHLAQDLIEVLKDVS